MPSHPSGTGAPSRRGLLSRLLAGLATLAWGAQRGAALADAPAAFPRAPRRRPRANLKPPSLPFPPSRIVEPVRMVAASPRDFSLQAFERALRAGGVIRLGPGIYDLTGIRAQPLAGVRIEGAGKHVTVLRGAFDVDRDFSPRASDVVGIITGRVELADLTFDRVRAVYIGAGSFQPNSTSATPDAGALQSLASGHVYPTPFPNSMSWWNVAVTNSARAVWMEEAGLDDGDPANWKKVVNDGYFFHCDFINLWHALAVKSAGAMNNWLWYNCYFENLIYRWTGSTYGGRNLGVGIKLMENPGGLQGKTDYDTWGANNIRLEHCTFNGLSCTHQPRAGDDGEHIWVYAFRVVNAYRNCWAKNCYFRNMGWDKDGGRQCSLPETSGLFYTKGPWLYENVVVDRICLGDSGIFNDKSPGEPGMFDQGFDIRSGDFLNVYVRNVEEIPSSARTDGGGIFTPKNIFFTAQAVRPRFRNVTIEDAITDIGPFPQFFDTTGLMGSLDVQDYTATGLTIRNTVGALFRIGGTSHTPAPSITVDNVVSQFNDAAPEPLAAVKVTEAAGDITLTNIEMDVNGAGVTTAALLRLDAAGTVTAVPTGRIVGAANAYAQTGSAVTDLTLADGPRPAGATLAWLLDEAAAPVGSGVLTAATTHP